MLSLASKAKKRMADQGAVPSAMTRKVDHKALLELRHHVDHTEADVDNLDFL